MVPGIVRVTSAVTATGFGAAHREDDINNIIGNRDSPVQNGNENDRNGPGADRDDGSVRPGDGRDNISAVAVTSVVPALLSAGVIPVVVAMSAGVTSAVAATSVSVASVSEGRSRL